MNPIREGENETVVRKEMGGEPGKKGDVVLISQ